MGLNQLFLLGVDGSSVCSGGWAKPLFLLAASFLILLLSWPQCNRALGTSVFCLPQRTSNGPFRHTSFCLSLVETYSAGSS